MEKVNYHIHTTGSDGKLSPRQVVEEAIQEGIKHICFTDHYFLPSELSNYSARLHKRTSHEDYYHQEIMKLKEEFKDKIDISFGMEFDYLGGLLHFTKREISKRNYDFIIGSIHVIRRENEFVSIPWSQKDWVDFGKTFGGVENAIKAYFEQVRKLIESGLFDCVGHMDVIKNCYPDDWKDIEKQDWYKEIIFNLLDEIKKDKICIEINTSGLVLHAKEQYPSEWILKEAKKRDIPITIGNDFHRDSHRSDQKVDADLNTAINLAKKVGYKKILIFKKRKPIEVDLE